jgi:Ca2+-binding RTX toxin-like protein
MAAFLFSNVTQAQALSYTAAADRLLFNAGSGSQVAVFFTGALIDGVLTIALQQGDRLINIADTFRGETDAVFPDGSMLFAGTIGNDTQTGTAFPDGLYGGLGNDTLAGADGADLIQGNQGNDTLGGRQRR